ncbi:MAG: DNA pilot protein [Microvirus sp.]|nr:MAG: DNA pilot protein [Microvirus sp.]
MSDFFGSLVSGIFDIAGDETQAGRDRQAQRHADDMTRLYAENSIQLRAADARKAGISPLVALGSPGISPPPITVGQADAGQAMSHAGQNIGSAVARMTDTGQKAKDQAELGLVHAQTAESDARRDLYVSEAAKNRQAGLTGMGIQNERGTILPEGQVPNTPGSGVPIGMIDVEAPKVQSPKINHPETLAGINPSMEEVIMPGNLPFTMPKTQGNSPEETISEMSTGAWIGLLLQNQRLYGGNWLKDFVLQRYFGKRPEYNYKQSKDIPQPAGSYHPPRKPYMWEGDNWDFLGGKAKKRLERQKKLRQSKNKPFKP